MNQLKTISSALIIAQLLFPGVALAHFPTTSVSGNESELVLTMHAEPNHNPIENRTSTVFFFFDKRTGVVSGEEYTAELTTTSPSGIEESSFGTIQDDGILFSHYFQSAGQYKTDLNLFANNSSMDDIFLGLNIDVLEDESSKDQLILRIASIALLLSATFTLFIIRIKKPASKEARFD